MATLTAADRTDLNRAARIIGAITVAGPAIAEVLHPWVIRFPAIGAVVAALEVLWSVYAKSSSTPPTPPAGP